MQTVSGMFMHYKTQMYTIRMENIALRSENTEETEFQKTVLL